MPQTQLFHIIKTVRAINDKLEGKYDNEKPSADSVRKHVKTGGQNHFLIKQGQIIAAKKTMRNTILGDVS